MALKPGDVMELGIWMDGTETQELKDRFRDDLRAGFEKVADESGVLITPIRMIELRPGDDRVPPVPDTLQGPDVRFLVGEAEVMDYEFESEGKFVADLEPKDLERLRTILRRVHRSYGNLTELSDEKCDEYINQNGPDAAVAALREQVGVKVN